MALINGKPFHVVGDGCVVSRRGGRIVATRDGTMLASAPLAMVAEVVVTGNVTVTTPTLRALLSAGVPLVLLSGAGRPLGRLEPPSAPHVEVRVRQLRRHLDPGDRLAMGRAIVAGKVRNQGILLRRRARRAERPDTVWRTVERLVELEQRSARCSSLASLMGVEGAAAGVYYRALRDLLDPGLGFRARDRRGPDVVNALTNYCSALLREQVMSGLLAAGLDPSLSFLHAAGRGRPTLVFDLMEEWRPVLLDSTVVASLGLRSVTPADLVEGPDGVLLSGSARAQAVTRFQARLAAPARCWPAPPAGHRYMDRVRAQCLAFRDWVSGDAPAYPPFVWR